MGSISIDSPDHDLDILIVGGGFSGVYSLYALRQLNPTPRIKLVEAGSDFGGVWYYNRYPGARVDSEWPCYQLSIPELWRDWSYKERFPDHAQIRAYFAHADNVLDLKKDAVFNTIVNQVDWDDSIKRWTSRTQNGKTFTSKYLLVCSGSSYKRHLPNFKGIEKFRGQLLHSSAFPKENVDVTGKRVGIIGNGASGVQLVQELAKHDCQLTNFIRTPNTAVPMRQRTISKDEEDKLKEEYTELFQRLKSTKGGFRNKPNQIPYKDLTPEEREQVLERAWQAGGSANFAQHLHEHLFDEEVNSFVYNFWAKKVRARVTDPVKREIVAPLPQQNYYGTKRPSLEQDYYESLDRPNVTLVDLKKSPIREITDRGVVTEDGRLHELDTLVLATGYDALNGSQMALGIHDRHGRDLRQRWADGTVTYLGLTIPDMPNLFMSYGPQAPTALGNGPVVIEVQVDWIRQVIQRMEDEGIETIDPQEEPARKWGADNTAMCNKLFMSKEDSWWMGANIPGKKKEALNYVGGLDRYSNAIYDALDGWKGFDIVRKDEIS